GTQLPEPSQFSSQGSPAWSGLLVSVKQCKRQTYFISSCFSIYSFKKPNQPLSHMELISLSIVASSCIYFVTNDRISFF
uniref:Uncharacterized protein n=1 Tax=Oryctolagus cuniculus TaxID=9986 RepID=A0A5F9D8U0_RABIT